MNGLTEKQTCDALYRRLDHLNRVAAHPCISAMPDFFSAFISSETSKVYDGFPAENQTVTLSPDRIMGHGILDFPYGIVFSKKRNKLYVSDHVKGEIHAFEKDGTHAGIAGQGLDGPLGMLEESDGSLLICERRRYRVVRLYPDGEMSEWLSFDKTVLRDHGVLEPIQIHRYGGGYLFLLSDGAERVRSVAALEGGTIRILDTGDRHINGLYVKGDVLLAASSFSGEVLRYCGPEVGFLRLNRWNLPCQVYGCCNVGDHIAVLCNGSRSLALLDMMGRPLGRLSDLRSGRFADVHIHAITVEFIDGETTVFMPDNYNHGIHRVVL
jgi:hypothetical protein